MATRAKTPVREAPAPRALETPQNVVDDLRRRYDELTSSQKRIAEAVVEDPEFVAFATVDKLASKLGVSPSTVVRFTYRLGLDGYQDLQERVRALVRTQMRSATVADGRETTVTSHLAGTIHGRSFDHDLDNLRRTISGQDARDLTRAVDLISKARRVFVAGAGPSFAVAFYAALALDRIRGETIGLDGGGHEAAGQLQAMRPDDVLLVFTFPPYASSTLRVTRFAKKAGANIVAVTDTPISPVGQLVEIVLPTVVSGVSTQNSLVGAMAVANALLNGVTVARKADAIERYGKVTRLMNEWDQFVLKGDD